ncbi:MAG TPA: M28 family peptidase [Woeseiaceae bacterium]
MTTSPASAIDRQRDLWRDFESICDCGGRLAGTDSERAATDLLKSLGREATGVECRVEPVPYAGWSAVSAELIGPDGARHACHPLVRSVATPKTGLEAEVVDLGRGTPHDFDARRAEIAGRFVLVRHELMFAPDTIHRRLKYRMAVEAGAAGFLIAGPVPDSLVAGSSGRGDEDGIPAAGIAPETANAFAPIGGVRTSARLRLETREAPACAENLVFDLPGQTGEWVVLSAHIDGHDLAESAIDNASGLAVALDVARHLSRQTERWRRGLRLALFNVEEWALLGSAHHVAKLSDSERNSIALNVNLDSVAGGDCLTALTSGFAGLEPFLAGCAEQAGISLDFHRPLQLNSDHANFARAGVPAFRLVAGFADRSAATAGVLTSADTRDKVNVDALLTAARLAITITAAALDADAAEVRCWRGQ